jgi:hypothetical protein
MHPRLGRRRIRVVANEGARGVWKQGSESKRRDDLIIYEVMAESIDAEWWKNYRERLEKVFKQERILIRSHQLRLL